MHVLLSYNGFDNLIDFIILFFLKFIVFRLTYQDTYQKQRQMLTGWKQRKAETNKHLITSCCYICSF